MDISFILLFVGFLFMIIYITMIIALKSCPEDKIVYRFLPQSLEDRTLLPVPLDDIFNDMFHKPSPWIGSLNVYDKSAKEKLQDTNITQ